MKVSLKWLKQYIDVNLPPAELARQLTMAGSEVNAWQVIGGDWENVFIGRVAAVNPHPNADKLRLATIDLGTEQETVVCGAPNLTIGDKIVFARVGARLRDGHTGEMSRLKTAKIRGVLSSGMVCSEKELGISENHEGILVLPPEAPLGKPLSDYLGDVIFDLEVTPNRPDCLSVIGIAREVAALNGQAVRLPEAAYAEAAPPIESQVSITISDPDLCPRYTASLITGIKVAESPRWLQERLLACGMRPINNVVDVTNFVMMEYGEPLHPFSYSRVRGQQVIVRRAAAGEVMDTLDGVKRSLSPEMLVIADAVGPMAVAGVMGGAASEVTAGTTAILLESASFNPANIYETGSTLNLPSEARLRFERGISPEMTLPALRRATQLITELSGGQAARGLIDLYPGKKTRQPIRLPVARVKTLLGVEFSPEQILNALTALGFTAEVVEPGTVHAVAPYWRSDINLTEDLIEEVARIIGYEKIPMTMLTEPIARQDTDPIIDLKRRTRQHLAGFGFQEVATFSLTSLELISKMLPEPRPLEGEVVRMANPMTADQEYLRPSLRAQVLAAVAPNQRFESGGIRLFELGRVFLPKPKDLPEQPEMVCGVLTGARDEAFWRSNSEPVDFFDAKGVVETLLSQDGVRAAFQPGGDASLHPSRQAEIIVGGIKVGVVGELHPKVARAFELVAPAYLFEINLALLLPFTLEHKPFQPIPRFPGVVRDIALVVDAAVTHAQVQGLIRGFSLVSQVAIFDVFAGGHLPPGKKSLAYHLTYLSPAHTLTDEEVDRVQGQILEKLAKELGATLRA
jgi:phenylalanyl-tRNA synthetase beta chain